MQLWGEGVGIEILGKEGTEGTDAGKRCKGWMCRGGGAPLGELGHAGGGTLGFDVWTVDKGGGAVRVLEPLLFWDLAQVAMGKLSRFAGKTNITCFLSLSGHIAGIPCVAPGAGPRGFGGKKNCLSPKSTDLGGGQNSL